MGILYSTFLVATTYMTGWIIIAYTLGLIPSILFIYWRYKLFYVFCKARHTITANMLDKQKFHPFKYPLLIIKTGRALPIHIMHMNIDHTIDKQDMVFKPSKQATAIT